MSINKFSEHSPRRKVGFVETIPTEAIQIFESRGYQCVVLDKKLQSDDAGLWEMDCLVLMQDIDNPKGIYGELEKYAPQFLPRDCRIYVKPVDSQNASIFSQAHMNIIAAIDQLKIPNSGIAQEYRQRFIEWDEGSSLDALGPFVHILNRGNDWAKIANVIRGNPADHAPKWSLNIQGKKLDGEKLNLDDEKNCLIRRAFNDCDSVDLVALGNGLSNIDAYKAYVQLPPDQIGRGWPYVYFVKLGDRKKIATEYRAYLSHALDHIPYHLGPRLRRDRCALGYRLGVIVTDYVHAAETLKDCARDYRAGVAIGNLFSYTLRNWYNSAKLEDLDIRADLARYVEKNIPPHRKEMVQTFGSKVQIDDLRELIAKGSSRPALVGVIHGDLHATNVLVRANDAIVIDFEKLEVSRGPLLYDVASVECGLFIDGFVGDQRSWEELLASIQSLYEPSALDHLYEPSALDQKVLPYNINDRSAWFFECVRLLRMHAREMERTRLQYAWVLAAVFLKKSCNAEDFDKLSDKPAVGLSREQIRALAYVLAERILISLSDYAKLKKAK